MVSKTSPALARLDTVRARIEDACQKHSRNSADVKLVAVGKTHPAEQVAELFDAGQRLFAENYVQEGIDKVRTLSELDIEWHFIGHIQSNKCRDIAGHFRWIHSVDRFKIADRLNSAVAPGEKLDIMLQVNIDDESSKSGVAAEDLDELVERCAALENLRLRGLMSIPAPRDEFEAQRKAFRSLRELAEKQCARGYGLDCLSMGMSADIEAAIAEGATHVRVGTALFGPRSYPNKE